MTQTVKAVFENGVLRPLSPLILAEKEYVQIIVCDSTPDALHSSSVGPVPTLDQVRAITAKIPVSLSELISQERDAQ